MGFTQFSSGQLIAFTVSAIAAIGVSVFSNYLYDFLRSRSILPDKPTLKMIFAIGLGVIAFAISATLWVNYYQPLSTNPQPQCNVIVDEISASNDVIRVGEQAEFSVSVRNPVGEVIRYDWGATHGKMNPGLNSGSDSSTYTAPISSVDDFVNLTVSSPNCSQIIRKRRVSIIPADTTPESAPSGHTFAPTSAMEGPQETTTLVAPTTNTVEPTIPTVTTTPAPVTPTPTNTLALATPMPTNTPEPPAPTPTNILGSPTPTLDCSPLSLDDSLSKGAMLAGNVEFISPSEKCGYIRENQPITVTVKGTDSGVSVWLIAFEPDGNYLYPHQCTLAQSSDTDFRCVTPQMEMFSSYVFSFVLADAKAADFLGSHNSFEVRDLEGKGDITELRRIFVKLSQ